MGRDTTDSLGKTADASPQEGNPEVLQQLIETMEAILEVFPEDVSALESLSAAYQQAGDNDKAGEAAFKLAKLIVAEGSLERAYVIVDHVLELLPDHAGALAERTHIAQSLSLLGIDACQLTAKKEQGGEEADTPAPQDRDLLMLDLSGELELAWLLLQKNLLTQEQYEMAIAGLTESRSSAGSSACLSLLIEVAAMDGVNMDQIIGELSRETSLPYIDLGRCELTAEVISMIPFDDARRIGVLPFALFKDEALVATLNPVDKNLRTVVSTFLNRRTHFFLVSPDQFQSALMSAMALLENDEAAASSY